MSATRLPDDLPASSVVDVGEVLGVRSGRGPAARTISVRTGPWRPADEPLVEGAVLPLLVVEGAMQRTVALRGREGADLAGPGELLMRDRGGEMFETRYRALTRSRIAVLDERVRAAVATDVELSGAILDAAVRRASLLGSQVVLAQLVAIDDRLRVLFPSLAERWGIVTPDGVVLPAFLSHTVLAALVGARRPSLTAAVGRLVEEGVVRRLPDRRWVLSPDLGAVA